jgi:hypothetical protein
MNPKKPGGDTSTPMARHMSCSPEATTWYAERKAEVAVAHMLNTLRMGIPVSPSRPAIALPAFSASVPPHT